MTRIVVFGVGKIAEVFHGYVEGEADLTIAGFTCDREFIQESEFLGLPLVPFDEVEALFPPAVYDCRNTSDWRWPPHRRILSRPGGQRGGARRYQYPRA
jgi:hypothetical protein